MKKILTVVLILSTFTIDAQKIIPLYQGKPPGSENWTHQEKESHSSMWNTRVVYNVVQPSLTVFEPQADEANGTAVVICPGGGFHALSIDSEGFDVARWLAAKGIICFVLKYRLVESKTNDPAKELFEKGSRINTDVVPVIKLATVDALKAIEYVRSHAKEYRVNPNRIGIIGFSAGGTVACSVAYNYSPNSRPDFVAPIYLQYEWALKKEVPAEAPPMFLLAATNDELGLASHSINLYNHWTAARKSAELIIYEKGGHGFGMKKQNLPSDKWIERFADWLSGRGLLKRE